MPHRVHEPDGPPLVHRVEIGGVDVPHLLQLALVPAGAPHPFALAHTTHLFGHHGLHVGDVLDVRVAHVETVEAVRAPAREVDVRVHHPGGDRASRQIDTACLRSRQGLDFGRRADSHHPLATHRNRFGQAALPGGPERDSRPVHPGYFRANLPARHPAVYIQVGPQSQNRCRHGGSPGFVQDLVSRPMSNP